MLKPDLRISEKVASWPIEVRYFWVLLWGYVDDYGKAKDSPLLVKADCFPLDEAITGETVDEWLWALAEAGVIVRYTVDGANYLAVVNWSEHQKPQHPAESKVPDSTSGEVRMRDSSIMHEVLTPELGLSRDGFEIGNGSSPRAVMVPDLFPDFWSVWPRKEGKADAKKAWVKAARKHPPDQILERAREYAASPHLPDRQFIPHAATWLNGERWNDEPLRGPKTRAEQTLDVLEMGRRMQEVDDRKALT